MVVNYIINYFIVYSLILNGVIQSLIMISWLRVRAKTHWEGGGFFKPDNGEHHLSPILAGDKWNVS